MEEQFLQLYKKNSSADSAYLIADGKVFLFVTEADKYILQGKNLIVGATELVLESKNGESIQRLETALAVKGTTIKKIPTTTLLQGLENNAFAMNLAIVEAKSVVLTNEILKRDLQLDAQLTKEKSICMEYYIIIQSLQKEYDKRRLPWLKELIDKYKTSIIFKKGEAFTRSTEAIRVETPKELSSNTIEFPPGSMLCQEGSVGDFMYILESGNLEVFIQNVKVATISEKGTVIGEIAMLLSMPRTATLKAQNTVIVTKVTREDLKNTSSPKLIQMLLVSLAKKHHANIVHIEDINQKKALAYAEKKEQEPHKTDVHRYYNELSQLKSSLEKIIHNKQADYLEYILKR
ncbi:MAG: cyclic nucleotide-binding domain-containing protein [Spirochaetes bacterium]|nr:cyclic nucleotide-binding domain-containing protein [Spirochaetota bacterium]